MSITYTMRESFSGFKRAKLASSISVVTISISLLLLGIFVIVTMQASRFIDALRNKVEMEAFLEEPLSQEAIAALRRNVLAIPGVENVEFVSKDEAAKIFREEWGEDISKVLDFNPLPPSFRISLADGYKTAERARTIYTTLTRMSGIESVKYWSELLDVLDQRTATVHNITLLLGVIIGLSAVFLVSNTIRLAIHAKRRIIRTMELVGATSMFIRLPFLLEGIMQGFLGGVLASALFYTLLEYLPRILGIAAEDIVQMAPSFYVTVIGTGMTLGLLGSIISVARFIGVGRAR